MARFFKISLLLIILGLIGLIGYSYIGDISSPNVDIIQPVKLDED